MFLKGGGKMKNKLDELINGKVCPDCGGRIIFGDTHICSLRERFLKSLGGEQ
jgi:hypothetical protein